MTSYKKYPKYKDSNVTWLGEIPEHWNIFQLKRTIDRCINGIWGSEPNSVDDITVLRVADFNRNQFSIKTDKLTIRAVSIQERQNRLLKKGDLLLEKSGGGENQLVGIIVIFDLDNFIAVTSNFVAKMTPLNNFNSKFLVYAFAHLYANRVNYMSIKQNTGIQNLDNNQYLSEYFSFPPLQEQQAIANYLDKATAKIDTLIQKQEKLIELLKEKRQALISHAVTKGLNPDAKMKESGIEWLGEIPEHWEVKKFKYSARIQGGKDQKEVLDDNGQFPVYGSGGIFGYANQYLYNGESVLLGRKGTVDKPLYVNDKFWTVDTMYFTIMEKTTIVKWFYYVTTTIHFDYFQYGSAVPSMTQEDLHNIYFATPLKEEQIQIAQYLDEKTSKIDKLITKATKAIDLLKEKRTALISAAVTGKIDVRKEI